MRGGKTFGFSTLFQHLLCHPFFALRNEKFSLGKGERAQSKPTVTKLPVLSRYFTATLASDPGQRHLFSVGDSTLQAKNPAKSALRCLTCEPAPSPDYLQQSITDEEAELLQITLELEGNNTARTSKIYHMYSGRENDNNATWWRCGYAKSVVSPDASHYALDCLGPGVPFSRVFTLPDNKPVYLLDGNDAVRAELQKAALPNVKDFEVDLPGTEVKARVRLILPPGLRSGEDFIFPLVLNM